MVALMLDPSLEPTRVHREPVVHGLTIPVRERRARVDDHSAPRVRVADHRDCVTRGAERCVTLVRDRYRHPVATEEAQLAPDANLDPVAVLVHEPVMTPAQRAQVLQRRGAAACAARDAASSRCGACGARCA